jgi:hypothetical protein
MIRLSETNGANDALIKSAFNLSIDFSAMELAKACWRRVEADAFEAWGMGRITVRVPETNGTDVINISSIVPGRYTTPAPWNGVGVNAFDELIAWLRTGENTMGAIEGVLTTSAVYNRIRRDAPASAVVKFGTANTIKRQDLVDAISDQLDSQSEFRFEVMENTLDVRTGQSNSTTKTRVWAQSRIAAIPRGGMIGNTHRVPSMRAQEVYNIAPAARVDTSGVALYPFGENSGKTLKLEAQLMAFPFPDIEKLWVANTGI